MAPNKSYLLVFTPFHIDSDVGLVIWFGQWHIGKHKASRDLISAWTLVFTLLGCHDCHLVQQVILLTEPTEKDKSPQTTGIAKHQTCKWDSLRQSSPSSSYQLIIVFRGDPRKDQQKYHPANYSLIAEL